MVADQALALQRVHIVDMAAHRMRMRMFAPAHKRAFLLRPEPA